MVDLDIIQRGVTHFKVKSSEYRAGRDEYFCLCKTVNPSENKAISKQILLLGTPTIGVRYNHYHDWFTYFIPRHLLDPELKETIYFSRYFRSSRSSHRSGTKLYESGNISSL